MNRLVIAVEAKKQGVAVGEDTGVGIDVCGWLRGEIRNTPRIAETNREGPNRTYWETEGDAERKEVRSI